MDDSLISLQEELAHQAMEISRLSDEMYAQQREISQLKRQISTFKETMESMSQMRDAADETPPPHY